MAKKEQNGELMKPAIIYIKEEVENDDKIILSKEDFEKYINEAYEQGKRDGAFLTLSPVTSPSTPTPYYPNYTTITCDASVKNTPADGVDTKVALLRNEKQNTL